MRVDVGLTVNSRDKVFKSTAVKRKSSGPLPLLVLLNSLQDQLLLKRGNRKWHRWTWTTTTLHRLSTHAWRHIWSKPTNTCVHLLSQSHIMYGAPENSYPLTAFTILSALGMCSKSTNGWVKNSAKVIRASGFLSSSRNRRSLQSLDTLAPGGSWCTKHNLIVLQPVHRTIQGERTAHCCHGHSSPTSPLTVKRWPLNGLCKSLYNGPCANAIH